MTLDGAIALVVVAAAAVYLGWRLRRVLRSPSGCACPAARSCPAVAALADTLRVKPWEDAP